MQHIIILRAIPGAGKTTWVKEFLKQNKDYVVLSRDSIRDMLYDHSNSFQTEMIVTKFYNKIFREALENKFNIILDNTHARPKHIKETLDLIAQVNQKANVELKQFDYDLETCIERDSKRERIVGRKVIEKIHKIIQQNPKEDIEKLINDWKNSIHNKSFIIKRKYNDNLEDCVIFDVDGTLALNVSNRGYYDWKRVNEDILNPSVFFILKLIEKYNDIEDNKKIKIIIVSGRDSVCKKETTQWLENNKIHDFVLYMRKENDNRSDVVIKKEIFDNYIDNKYNVLAVFDDRLNVCRQWYQLGLPLFRVGNPDANF